MVKESISTYRSMKKNGVVIILVSAKLYDMIFHQFRSKLGRCSASV